MPQMRRKARIFAVAAREGQLCAGKVRTEMSTERESLFASPAQVPRVLTVLPGDYSDVCALCGIHRQNAGFLKETCGDGYLQPGCFIQEVGPHV